MKITNKTGLPDAIANYREYTENSKYSSGGADFSVTTLIDSPRIKILSGQHRSSMEKDASEDIYAMLGTAMHSIIETGAGFDTITEERLFVKVHGKTISGQIDLQEIRKDGSVDITDFKVSSVWSEIIDKLQKRDWITQLNLYAELVEKAKGVKVNSINICCLFRDWSKTESKRRNDYPDAAIKSVRLPLWTSQERAAYLDGRVMTHAEAKEGSDKGDGLPLCSDEDRWHRPGKFALMKEGRKTAVKLFDTVAELMAWAATNGHCLYTNYNTKSMTNHAILRKGMTSLERPTKYVRCDDWCSVSQWCSQLKAEKLLKTMEENNKA